MTSLLRPYLFLVFGILSQAAAAQENYQDGYIIRAGKDTVRGRIDFRDWVANPDHISFLDPQTGRKTAYAPHEIAAFFAGGETYRGYTVRISPYSANAARAVDESSSINPYDSAVFLRLITEGKLSLYYYRDRSDITYYFIQRNAEMPEQLRIKTTLVERDGVNAIMTDDVYRDQLTDWLADCPTIARQAGNATYTEKALRKLVFAYNNCGKDTAEHQAVTVHRGKTVSLSPLVGYFHSSIRVNGDADAAHMKWPSCNSVTGGIGMLLAIPRARDQWAFYTDLLYRHIYSASSSYAVGYETTKQAWLDYDQVQLDIQFRYRYPAGKVRPFLNIGISSSLIVSDKSKLQEYELSSLFTTSPLFGDEGGLKTLQIGLIGGGGITTGRFSLEARIAQSQGVSAQAVSTVPMITLNFLAGYSF